MSVDVDAVRRYLDDEPPENHTPPRVMGRLTIEPTEENRQRVAFLIRVCGAGGDA